jgi:hypothetical protein
MPPTRGKRHSAFNDFPVEPAASPASDPADKAGKSQPARVDGPAPLFGDTRHILTQPTAPEVERIERLRPSQMIPDRFQPRRLLPGSLRPAFFNGQIDCYQAAAQWLALAKNDSGIQHEIDRLMAMGLSFGEHGQIKPITGSWVPATDGGFIFQIETGERRFWAACLNQVAQALPEEPLLRVEVVSAPTRQRQVLENQHAEAPSDVGRACEVAALILSELGISPDPQQVDEFDYFRQARQQSMTGKLWDKLSGIMQMTRPRMIQLLNILKLPTPQLDLADRYRVPERVIREVLNAPRQHWDQLLVSSIQNSLTSDEVAELAQKPKPVKRERAANQPADPAQSAIASLKRFTYLMEELDETIQAGVLDELANDLVSNGRAEGLVNLMHELARLVQIRQQNLRRRH